MTRLENKVAIVTGGAGSIGAACSKAFARNGSAVVVADLPGSDIESVVAAIAKEGGQAIGHEVDITSEVEVASMISRAMNEFGHLDILHNNAAATEPEQAAHDGSIVDLSLTVWDRAIAVNLRGPLLGCKHAIPVMLRTGGGAIINTSSVVSLYGDLHSVAYATSKGGLNTLTRYVATQYGKLGIRCNAIAPGVIMTPGVEKHFTPDLLEIYEQNHLTPRLGTPADVAQLAVFLASDESTFVTGQVIAADGGLCSHMPTVAQFRAMPAE